MRAGARKHLIVVQQGTATLNGLGTPEFTWSEVAQLRAEIVQEDTAEIIRRSGATDETVTVFRTIWAGSITTAHRVLHAGRVFNVREVMPTYHQYELDLHCIAFNQGD
jgi:head-tail adaptor